MGNLVGEVHQPDNRRVRLPGEVHRFINRKVGAVGFVAQRVDHQCLDSGHFFKSCVRDGRGIGDVRKIAEPVAGDGLRTVLHRQGDNFFSKNPKISRHCFKADQRQSAALFSFAEDVAEPVPDGIQGCL